MATSHDITTTYSGQAASPYLSAALLTGKSLASGAIDIKANLKYIRTSRDVKMFQANR